MAARREPIRWGERAGRSARLRRGGIDRSHPVDQHAKVVDRVAPEHRVTQAVEDVIDRLPVVARGSVRSVKRR